MSLRNSERRRDWRYFREFLARHASTFNALGQFYFLFRGQKRDAADFFRYKTVVSSVSIFAR